MGLLTTVYRVTPSFLHQLRSDVAALEAFLRTRHGPVKALSLDKSWHDIPRVFFAGNVDSMGYAITDADELPGHTSAWVRTQGPEKVAVAAAEFAEYGGAEGIQEFIRGAIFIGESGKEIAGDDLRSVCFDAGVLATFYEEAAAAGDALVFVTV